MNPVVGNITASRKKSTVIAFAIAAIVDLMLYAAYRLWINPSGLLESDDLFYFELAEFSIGGGYSPVLHLASLNRAIVFIIQILFESFDWNDPAVFVCPGILLYWFAAHRLFAGRAYVGSVILIILLLYPDVMYVRYHMFKDIILVSLLSLFIHLYEQRKLPLALMAALLCAPFRFYLFPLILACVLVLNLRRFNVLHLIASIVFILAFSTQVDIVSIVSGALFQDTFASGGDYTVKRVAESLGISSPLLLLPLVALSFFLQPAPHSILESGFDQIVPYSFFSTYLILLPILLYILRYKMDLNSTSARSTKFIFLFTFVYVLTFAFDPVLADMRHRVILLLPLLMVFFQVRQVRVERKFRQLATMRA